MANAQPRWQHLQGEVVSSAAGQCVLTESYTLAARLVMTAPLLARGR